MKGVIVEEKKRNEVEALPNSNKKPKSGTNVSAILGFSFPILGFVLSLLGVLLAALLFPAGLACSVFALVEIKKTPQKGKVLAIVGLVISLIFTVIFGNAIVSGYNEGKATVNISNAKTIQVALEVEYVGNKQFPICDGVTFSEAIKGCLKGDVPIELSETKCTNGGGLVTSTSVDYKITPYKNDCKTPIDAEVITGP